MSIGINLNPDTACNFDCIYCQVDRSAAPRVRDIDPRRLGDELSQLIGAVGDGSLFADAAFADVPEQFRRIRDIAFSGDGEPTTCPCFSECVDVVAAIKCDAGLTEVKIVLITDACYLTKPKVATALSVLDSNQGEIWAKLDAGTESYYKKVNRPNYPLRHVMKNIMAAAHERAIVIQSLFMRIDGEAPPESELIAFSDRLNEIQAAGGRIDRVQVYTVARRPTESYVTALAPAEVDSIVALVRGKCGLNADPFYGQE